MKRVDCGLPRRAARLSLLTMTAALAVTTMPGAAHAQAAPIGVVSVCSGVSLPRSVVTDIMRPVITGIADPVESRVNDILGVIDVIPIVGRVLPRLNLNATGLLNDAATGAPITLRVLDSNGTIVGPADPCNAQADSFSLRTPGGMAIGGNRITGLGADGQLATAGEINSIAFGNSASTAASAPGAIAIGQNAAVGAGAGGSIALGTGAAATAANSVALGANSTATRGPSAGYAALGLAAPQTSAGEISVGAAGAERQITNVAAGSAPTDAVNVGQLAGVAARIDGIVDTAVIYDDLSRTRVTFGGAGGTTLTNVAAGQLSAGSSDAVNGAQLFATNQNVATNTTAIVNLTTQVQAAGLGTVRYSDPATPTVPNGGTPTNDLTLVGASPAPVGLHNVRDGVVAAGSTDAVNGGQLFAVDAGLAALSDLAVQYDDAGRTRVTLGGAGAAPVSLVNLAPGAIAAGSTEAVNGGQLFALGGSLAASFGGGTTFDPTLGIIDLRLSFGGTTYSNVQAAFDAIGQSVAAVPDLRYFQVQSGRAGATAAGTDSMALGPEALATASNSVALGTASLAGRGAVSNYAALGLSAPQSSVGEVSVGFAGGERQITNVAAGSAATDAVNVAQLQGVADQVAALDGRTIQYDNADRSVITLGGANGTVVTNVAAGAVTATSTDAVNGSQLAATNAQVANNTTAITNLSVSVSNGATGPVQYTNGNSTTPNGGTRTNDVALVGANAGPVGLHNVGDGRIAAGSTDAVNGGQIHALALTAVNAVSYDTDATGARTNSVTLSGGTANAPVSVQNVAAGTVAAGSTDAVNGGQLHATNQAVASVQGVAANSVQYDTSARTSVTLGGSGATGPVVLQNVGPGVAATDAVNLSQLNSSVGNALSQANAYTDQRLLSLNYDLRSIKKDADSGSAGALAAAALPQAYEAGKGMLAFGAGTYGGESAFAVGFSKAFDDGHTVVKFGGTYDTRGRAGANAGVGYQF